MTKQAKIYRFKETGMWRYDYLDERYYTSPKRKYVTYVNPWIKGLSLESQLSMEYGALVNALTIAQTINRTLILPAFHCPKNRNLTLCNLHALSRIDLFHNAFGFGYREHVFLQNPQVPKQVTWNQSPYLDFGQNGKGDDVICENVIKNVTSTEVRTCLKPVDKYAVIRFNSLYDLNIRFSTNIEQKQFDIKVRRGLLTWQKKLGL